jgi:F0F1-type ATP synthase delta subunit
METINKIICAKCGNETEDKFRVMNNVICEDCVEKHTKGDMPDTFVFNFLEFIVERLKITNIMYVYKIFKDNKNIFVDSMLKETYDNYYSNITFEKFKEIFVELIFNDVFLKCKYYNIIEDNKFYIAINEKIEDEKLLEIEKEIKQYVKDYITYLIEYMTDNDYIDELEEILIEFENAGYYRGSK